MKTDTHAFLDDLSTLSQKHGIAIAGAPVLFLLERADPNDAAIGYGCDEESRLLLTERDG